MIAIFSPVFICKPCVVWSRRELLAEPRTIFKSRVAEAVLVGKPCLQELVFWMALIACLEQKA